MTCELSLTRTRCGRLSLWEQKAFINKHTWMFLLHRANIFARRLSSDCNMRTYQALQLFNWYVLLLNTWSTKAHFFLSFFSFFFSDFYFVRGVIYHQEPPLPLPRKKHTRLIFKRGSPLFWPLKGVTNSLARDEEDKEPLLPPDRTARTVASTLRLMMGGFTVTKWFH